MSQTTITDDLFQSSISFISPGMGSVIVEDGTIDENLVLLRLNQLRMWQQNQQQALIDQQLSQRELLYQEKNKLYEMFGLSMNSENDIENDEDEDDDTSEAITVKENLKSQNDKTPSKRSTNFLNKNEEILLKSPPITLNMDKIIQNMSIRTMTNDENQNLPKHRYLKRGEGLKKRFQISPDALRLNNLPKYKYRIKTHAPALNPNRRHTEEKRNPYDDVKTSAIPSTVTTTKLSGEGHQNKSNENIKYKNPKNQLKNIKRLSGELKLKSQNGKNINGAANNGKDVNAVTLVHSSNGK